MNELDKSKDQLLVELKLLRQEIEIIENKSNLLKYNGLISNTKDNISLINKNYLYFDVNETYLKVHNIKREDVVGKLVENIFGKEVFTNYIKGNVDKCLAGEIVKYQKWFDFPKNVRKYMDVAFYPFYGKDNSILGVMVSSHDITELKTKEELLTISELKQKSLIQNIPGMVYTSVSYQLKEVVSGSEEICGYSIDELQTGKIEWINIIHKDDKEKLLLKVEKIFKKAQTIIATYRITTKNGELRWVEDRMTSCFYEVENHFRVDGIVFDITDRKKTELALKESEEYFRTLIENSSDVISILDNKGYITYESPSHKRVLGYNNLELLERNVFELVHPDDKKRIFEQFVELIKMPNAIEHVNFRFLHKNGNWQYIEGTGRNLLSSDIVKGIVVNYRDVTDRKKIEQALKESEAMLRESNATKDKFFAIIAHDLKNPFNTMLGFSNLLIKNFDSQDVQEQKQYLAYLNHDIQNTYKLLENLLMWSRSQRGTIDFYPEKENLFLLSEETISLLKRSAVNKSIELINKIPEDIYLKVDKNMLSIILRNLTANAIKFTKKGGTIEIGCRHVETYGRTSLQANTFFEIYVKDNGIGISKKKQARLFKISEEVSTKGTEGEVGTGLGLILCKEFVEKHGGKIWLESEEGKGSEFIFTL